MKQKYLTAKDVAKVYRLSRKFLIQKEQSGIINPFFTSGGHRRYRVEDIESLLRPRKETE